ncbi:MAG TPA: hypothetical protein VMD59_07490, partial [Acidimicrobiales bacterium]|nr:hypothetical protein [Acidimicrobiales bacterium]
SLGDLELAAWSVERGRRAEPESHQLSELAAILASALATWPDAVPVPRPTPSPDVPDPAHDEPRRSPAAADSPFAPGNTVVEGVR